MSVNINVFNFNNNGIQPDFFNGINGSALQGVDDILSDIFNDFSQLFDQVGSQFSGGQNIMGGGCVVPPSPFDGSQPPGSLKADGDVVTTPGGYKIESTGKYDWKITGPDGKVTVVEGDPHVREGDGGKWDFKRDSTFVLGDGTRINVSTKPYGNGATVTSNLEIISGNDRVNISGIDEGKGKVGQITADGYAHANSFGGKDVFVMGRETDDWSFQGKEVIGSNNGGDSFKLGGDLPAGNANGSDFWQGYQDFGQLLHNFVTDLINDWNSSWNPNPIGQNPYYDNGSRYHKMGTGTDVNNLWGGGGNNSNGFWAGSSYDRAQHQQQMREAFKLFGELFGVMARLARLNDQMSTFRNRAIYA
ncbi:MAG: DUF1521 domain-containing protein [Acidobacteria bacterium]|nr:DUF1521 domain-containing protein [Acidobacteriota bacterium]